MTRYLRILIVDDQPRTRQSLKALLATGFRLVDTCEAKDGVEALKRFEECKPDLVLMDARMPEMDGIEATRLIKSKSLEVPIIVLSMYGEYEAAAREAAADAFIGKGESPERLLEVINLVLGLRAG